MPRPITNGLLLFTLALAAGVGYWLGSFFSSTPPDQMSFFKFLFTAGGAAAQIDGDRAGARFSPGGIRATRPPGSPTAAPRLKAGFVRE